MTAVAEGIKLDRGARAEPRLRLDRRAVGDRWARSGSAPATATATPTPACSTATCCRSTSPPTPRASAPTCCAPPRSTSSAPRSSRPKAVTAHHGRPRRDRPAGPGPSSETLVGRAGRRGRPRSTATRKAAGRRTTPRDRPHQRPLPVTRRNPRDEPSRTGSAARQTPGASDPHAARSGTRPPAQQQARGRAGRAGRRRRRGRRPPRTAFDSWRDVSLTRRARSHVRLPRPGRRAHVDELAAIISDEHGKVRLRRHAARCIRGLEVVEFACGIPHLLKGEYSDQVSTGVDVYSFRQPLGRRAPGITPFNFPVMVPMWMHPIAIATGNTFVLKPSERDPSASNLVAELYAEAGLPTGSSTSCTATRWPSTRCSTTPTSRPSRSSARRRSPGTCTSGRRRPASACRRSAARRTTRSCCPTPTSTSPPTTSPRRATARPGSAAWRSRPWWPSAPPPTRSWSGCATRPAAVKVGPGRDAGQRDGPGRHAPRRGSASSDYVDARRARPAPTLVVDGRGLAVAGHEDGFFVGPCLFDRVTTEMDVYTDEIFGPVLRRPARGHPRRGDRAGQRATRTATGPRIFTSSGVAARRFQRTRQGRHDRHQRADPGADGLLLVRRLEGLAVRRHPRPRPGGRPFYTRAKAVTTAGRTRRTTSTTRRTCTSPRPCSGHNPIPVDHA